MSARDAISSKSICQSEDRVGQITLSFYDHHRQSYGASPIRMDRAVAEFMVGDYGAHDEDQGVAHGGEFAIHLYALGDQFGGRNLSACLRVFGDATGSLREFMDSGTLDKIAKASKAKEIRTRDDLTALLIDAGLHDRSEFPVGHQPVCHCCDRPINA